MTSGTGSDPEVSSPGYGDLFRATWRAFVSQYGQLLGYVCLIILAGLLVGVTVFVVGLLLQINVFESGGLQPVMIAAALELFLTMLIISPLTAYLHYAVLRRLRDSSEPRRSGRYGMIVTVALVQACLFAPATFSQKASNPGEFAMVILDFQILNVQVNAMDNMGDEAGDPQSDEAATKKQETDDQISKLEEQRIPTNSNLQVVATVFWIFSAIIGVIWLPWAYLSILDPRSSVSTSLEALSHGWQLCAPSRWSVLGVFVVLMLILVATIILCCLPGLFFGAPLMMAAAPAVYMMLRGESVLKPLNSS